MGLARAGSGSHIPALCIACGNAAYKGIEGFLALRKARLRLLHWTGLQWFGICPGYFDSCAFLSQQL